MKFFLINPSRFKTRLMLLSDGNGYPDLRNSHLIADAQEVSSIVLDVAKTLYNAEEVQNFMKAVVECFKEADPATKEKIISNLREARPVRRAIQGPESYNNISFRFLRDY